LQTASNSSDGRTPDGADYRGGPHRPGESVVPIPRKPGGQLLRDRTGIGTPSARRRRAALLVEGSLICYYATLWWLAEGQKQGQRCHLLNVA
jgi:hypothetical protein